MILSLTTETLQSLFLTSSVPIILDIYADWCPLWWGMSNNVSGTVRLRNQYHIHPRVPPPLSKLGTVNDYSSRHGSANTNTANTMMQILAWVRSFFRICIHGWKSSSHESLLLPLLLPVFLLIQLQRPPPQSMPRQTRSYRRHRCRCYLWIRHAGY